MPSLQVRELPEHIYLQLCREAEAQHRSLAQQAVVVLARGLQCELDTRQRRASLLARINAEPIKFLTSSPLLNPAQLIREDRER